MEVSSPELRLVAALSQGCHNPSSCHKDSLHSATYLCLTVAFKYFWKVNLYLRFIFELHYYLYCF